MNGEVLYQIERTLIGKNFNLEICAPANPAEGPFILNVYRRELNDAVPVALLDLQLYKEESKEGFSDRHIEKVYTHWYTRLTI